MWRRIRLILISILWITSALFAQNPFNEGGMLAASFDSGPSNTSPIPAWAADSLSSRYGMKPDYIIWQGAQDTTNAFISIYYNSYAAESDTRIWWGDTLKWSQLRPYFRAVFTSVETGDTLIRDLPEDNPDKIVSLNRAGGYRHDIKIPSYQLSIPMDNSAWTLELVTTLDLSDSVTINPNNWQLSSVVRIERSTPLDSLLWLNTFWYEREISMEYKKAVLRNYPYIETILYNLFKHYYYQMECDSVTSYGERYIYAFMNNLDEFSYRQAFPYKPGPADSTVSRVRNMIDDICIDGYPQPDKYIPNPIIQ